MPLRSSSRDDWILRQLQAVAETLARVAQRRAAGEHEAGLREIAAARAELLGDATPLITRVDAATAAHLSGDPRQILALAQLEQAEGLIHRDLGDDARGAALLRRALELALEAFARDAELPRARELIAELAAIVPSESLALRTRAALQTVRPAP